MRDARPTLDTNDRWRELHRCEDLLQARAVATCVAAMEFDVRLRDRNQHDDEADLAPDRDPVGPFVIEVPVDHWLALRSVLDQIIDEQAEFDAMLEARRTERHRVAVVVLSVSALAEIIVMMRLIDA